MATHAKRGLDLALLGTRLLLTRGPMSTTFSASAVAKKPALVSIAACQRAAMLRLISTSCCRFAEAAKPAAAAQTATLAPTASAPPAAASAAAPAVPETPEIPVISADDVIRSLQYRRAIILDVRTQFEVNEFGKIPNSSLVPHDKVEAAMRLPGGEFKVNYGFYKPDPNGESIIVYCRSGKRAEFAAKVLRDKYGFRNVFNYQASWIEWEKLHPENVKKVMPSGEELQKLIAAAAAAAAQK
jgi:rhodanese-related sulfurtransferase